MKKQMLWAGFSCMAVLSLSLAAAAETIIRSSVSSYETIQCQGQPVEISGTSSQFELYGECPTLTIRGTGNTIKVERVGSIRIEGANNQVVWSQALTGSRPQVSTAGAGNTIIQGKMEEGRADGKAEVGGREGAMEGKHAALRVNVAGPEGSVEVKHGGVKVAGPQGAVEVNRTGVKVEGRDGAVEVNRAGVKAEGRDGAVEVNRAGVRVEVGGREGAMEERHADMRPDDADHDEPMENGHSHHWGGRPGPARDIEINGNEKHQTVTCHGENVRVEGNENHVRVQGECRAITVGGNENVCEVEAVRSISVSGNDNEVAWRHALGGDEPRISDDGNDNKVHKTADLVSKDGR